MRNFHGTYKARSFFEGWYLKHQNQNHTVAFIPSFHIDKNKNRFAQIQVITDSGSHCFRFSAGEFHADEKRFCVRIGENRFSSSGVSVNLSCAHFSVKGILHYAPFTAPESDIMGPFCRVPMMQCNHGVLSLTHKLHGTLHINGEEIDFTDGTGYAEKDWGSSFPRSYLWTQLNWHEHRDCCVMLSIADIPFSGTRFTGCICSVYYGGREYRLATYRGVKIVKYTENEVILEQNGYKLQAELLGQNAHKLQAPEKGAMTRVIHESPSCKVRVRFWVKNLLLFDVTKDNASFEVLKEEEPVQKQDKEPPAFLYLKDPPQ